MIEVCQSDRAKSDYRGLLYLQPARKTGDEDHYEDRQGNNVMGNLRNCSPNIGIFFKILPASEDILSLD
jgi:hypothetical protein